MKNPFKKTKINEEAYQRYTDRLRQYISLHYPWLSYEDGRSSYSVLRYTLRVTDTLNNANLLTRRIENMLARELGIVLAAGGCTVESDGDIVTVTVPREDREKLRLREGLEELLRMEKLPIVSYIGEYTDGLPAIINFEETPHFLIGGSTGTGKTTCMYALIDSLMFKYTPEEVKFYILDDKGDLSLYKNEPHVIDSAYDRDEFEPIINRLSKEFKERKSLISANGYGSLDRYNAKHKEKLPHIFVIFDEADVILARDSSAEVSDIARSFIHEACAESRSWGYHVIIGTQKPEGRNISTNIKSNIPGRIAFLVGSKSDSRVILDKGGAEGLKGKGDAYLRLQGEIKRLQCALVDLEEQEQAIKLLKKEYK